MNKQLIDKLLEVITAASAEDVTLEISENIQATPHVIIFKMFEPLNDPDEKGVYHLKGYDILFEVTPTKRVKMVISEMSFLQSGWSMSDSFEEITIDKDEIARFEKFFEDLKTKYYENKLAKMNKFTESLINNFLTTENPVQPLMKKVLDRASQQRHHDMEVFGINSDVLDQFTDGEGVGEDDGDDESNEN